MINKTLTGFMRAEVKKSKEANQSGANNYNSNSTIITEDEAVNHGGYSEEFASGNGANQQYEQEDDGDGGGLPMRLPTEVMNRPPSVQPEQQQQYEANPTDEYEYYEEEVPVEQAQEEPQQQQQYEQPPPQPTETTAEDAYAAELAALDQEMADQYFYISDGSKYGPFSLDDITEKYKNKDINDDTRIWSGDQTNKDAKPLRENKKIVANLPKPPPRKKQSTTTQNQQSQSQQNGNYQQTQNTKKQQQSSTTSSNNNNGKTQNVNDEPKPPANNGGGGCCIIL